MCRGSIDKIVPKSVANLLESELLSSSQHSEESSELKEDEIEIDFSKLDNSVKNFNEDALENHLKSLLNKQASMESEMEQIRPDFKVLS